MCPAPMNSGPNPVHRRSRQYGRCAGDDIVGGATVLGDRRALQRGAVNARFAVDRLIDESVGGEAGDLLRHRAFDACGTRRVRPSPVR